MERKIGEHPVWQLPVIGTVHSDTILTTWIVMVISLAFFWYMGASYRSPRVNRRQTTFEGLMNYLGDLAVSTLGPRGEPFVPFFIALFFMIFLLNQVGFIPLRALGLPFGGSPTADLNTTAAYAVIVFLMIQIVGIRNHGWRAYKHLFEPFPWIAPINLIEEIARPITLALRLFFNVFVGEILMFVLVTIMTSQVMIGHFNLSRAIIPGPFFLQFFNFFVGTLQAFVFTLLTIVYLSAAVAEEGH